MQDYKKDLITEIGKDVLSDTTESAIKDAINNALENGVQGKDIDFESLFNSVMESCARKILIDMCGDVEVVDSYNQKRLAGKLYKLITGQENCGEFGSRFAERINNFCKLNKFNHIKLSA